MKTHHLYALLALVAGRDCIAQQWYCENEGAASGFTLSASKGIAFVAGGKAYFGCGETADGLPGGPLFAFDPATNTTTAVDQFGSTRTQCTAFSVGGHGYVGLGKVGSDLFNEEFYPGFFMRYNATTDMWNDFVDYPGGLRSNAMAFTLNDIAYVGGGASVDTTGEFPQIQGANDMWAYDHVTDTWTPRANVPVLFTKAITFSLGNKGYLIPDNSANLWEYDPVANTWTARTPFPGGARQGISAIVLNGRAYVGCGRSTTDHNDFFAFDPATNSWSPAPVLWDGMGRSYGLTFSIGDSGYLVGGLRGWSTILSDRWRFGPETVPATGSWTQLPFLPAAGRQMPIAFSIGEKGYVGGGDGMTDFWEYDPATYQWTARATLPGNVDEGFSIDGLGYVTTTTATGNFFAYDPVSNAWTPRTDLPGGARTRAASFATEGKGYICSGFIGAVRQSDLWAYDPLSATWTQRASRPGDPTHGASGFAIGNKGYVMGGNLGGSSASSGTMHRYDPATDTWTTMGGIPLGNKQNAQAFAIGNMGYLGGGFTGGPGYLKRFDAYNPATNTWTALGDMGGNYRHDGVGFAIGEKGYLFGGRRNLTSGSPSSSGFNYMNDLWEFNPSTVQLQARVILDGPYDADDGLMGDDLRAAGLLTTRDPYALTGYPYPGGNYGDILATIPSATNEDAVVDRVIIELRSPTNPATVVATRHVWLQRDGDLVEMDGTSPVRFTLDAGDYHVAIQHRNHLGFMTANPISFGTNNATIDLSLPGTATFGTDARKVEEGVARAWCGDVTFNGQVKYVGVGNDRDPILVRIGGMNVLEVVHGYHPEDVNLDGQVKYSGTANDRDLILQAVGGSVPTNVRTKQLP